jgi:hypothetical protein
MRNAALAATHRELLAVAAEIKDVAGGLRRGGPRHPRLAPVTQRLEREP